MYDLAACGDPDAYDFLCSWHLWVHAIDDHVDASEPPQGVIGLCVAAAELFSNPFYLSHITVLRPLVSVIASKYAVSVEEPRLDGLRFAGNDMVLLVAAIQGGPRLVALVSRQLWPLVLETQL